MDDECTQFEDRRWALIPLMSGALRSGLILPLTIGLLAAGLRSAVSMAAVQSVAMGVSVVSLVLWSGWLGQLRTRPFVGVLVWRWLRSIAASGDPCRDRDGGHMAMDYQQWYLRTLMSFPGPGQHREIPSRQDHALLNGLLNDRA